MKRYQFVRTRVCARTGCVIERISVHNNARWIAEHLILSAPPDVLRQDPAPSREERRLAQ